MGAMRLRKRIEMKRQHTLPRALIAGLAALLAGCGQPCKNTIVSKLVSPDGKYEATAFIRDCGATTDFSPQVYVCPKGDPLKETGNVFIGDHSDKIRIEWASPTQLNIFSECNVVGITTKYEGITIEFTETK